MPNPNAMFYRTHCIKSNKILSMMFSFMTPVMSEKTIFKRPPPPPPLKFQSPLMHCFNK